MGTYCGEISRTVSAQKRKHRCPRQGAQRETHQRPGPPQEGFRRMKQLMILSHCLVCATSLPNAAETTLSAAELTGLRESRILLVASDVKTPIVSRLNKLHHKK